MATYSGISGGRASTAGDVFHELWALRAALGLVIPKTELKAITVEGIAAQSDSGHHYDGVDCGLFYGGSTFKDATRIEFVQLKYSTSAPKSAWTTARLTASSAKKKNNSVIRKLASDFSRARQEKAAGIVLAIKLVSNQPLDSEVLDAIKKIKAGNSTDPTAAKLIAASGIFGTELIEFLEVLDFSEMGSSSLHALDIAVLGEVSQMSCDGANDLVAQMQTQVRRLMLPDAIREIITAKTVYSWFGISSPSALFPAPPDFQPLENPIQRTVSQEVIAEITAGEKLICLHGLGGCGKTTTILQLQQRLPHGSVSTILDCYGAGRYSHSNDRRHLPENAFLQILNGLSLHLCSPFLIPKQSSRIVDIRVFIDRLKQMGELLSRTSAQGKLVIFIDAADNSITASENDPTAPICFVPELARANLNDLPSNVCIVISARTGRKDQLQLPTQTKYILCPSFSFEETRKFVDQYVQDLSDEWVRHFGALSSGIARVQNYALKKGAFVPENVLDALRPSGKGLNTVLQELFQNAAQKAGNGFYAKCIAAIDALPSPVPLTHIAAICSTTEDVIRDFVSDVSPTLRIEDDLKLTIADEDVEDFLKAESNAFLPATLATACAYFAPLYRIDEYAAIHYCDLLAKAGRGGEILSILERDVVPAGISDPIVRREVQMRRLRSALGACRKAGKTSEIIKVMLLSAEAAKDEASLKELLEQEAELSVRFAQGSLQRLVLSDRDSYPQQGTILVNDALRAALDGDPITANEAIYSYHKWMERRQEAERFHEWTSSLEDYVKLEQAIAVLKGPERLINHMQGWRSATLRLQLGLDLVPRLIASGHREVVEKLYEERLVPKPWNLLLSIQLALSGYTLVRDKLESDLSAFKKRLVPDLRSSSSQAESWQLKLLEVIITGCEIGYTVGVSEQVLLRVLSLLLDQNAPPIRSIHYTEVSKIDIALRAWLLRHRITHKEIATEQPDFAQFTAYLFNKEASKKTSSDNKSRQTERGDEEKKLAEFIGGIRHIYEARIDALTKAEQIKTSGSSAINLKLQINSYVFEREYHGSLYRTIAAQSIARLMHLPGLSTEYLFECSKHLLQSQYEDPQTNSSLQVWREFLGRNEVHQRILDEIRLKSHAIMLVRIGARDKANALLSFSKLVLNFSTLDAQRLFENAVVIIQEIDREAMTQIEFIGALTNCRGITASDSGKNLGSSYAAYLTDVAIRLEGEEHFPWEKSISALYDLSPETALAALAQWQDQGISDLHQSLAYLLHRIAGEGQKPVFACALFGLLEHASKDHFRLLVEQICSATGPERKAAFELLSKQLLLSVSPLQRTYLVRDFLRLLPQDVELGDIIAHLYAEAKMSQNDEKPTDLSGKDRRDALVPFSGREKFSSEEGIRDALRSVTNTVREQKSYIPLTSILSAIRQKITSPAQRVSFLNVAAEFDIDGFDASSRAEAIEETLETWKGPAIDSWKEQQLPLIIGKNFWALSRWLGEQGTALPKLVRTARLTGQALIDIVAGSIEQQAGKYSSRTLFAICGILAPHIPTEDAKILTEWYLHRLDEKVPADIKEQFIPSKIPYIFEEAVAHFIFAQFSDVEQSVRWRAAHCLRAIAEYQGNRILKEIFAIYSQKNEDAFRLNSAPFYWLSARLFTVMTVARIAIDHPEVVAPFVHELMGIISDNQLPHYLIRSYAKDALNSLLSYNPALLSEAEKGILAATNCPKVMAKKREEGRYQSLDWKLPDGIRFNFNSLDTIPYWYSPLYKHFAELTREKFFGTLDRWLIDDWKIDPESNWWNKEPRRKRYDNNSMAWYHGHGSLPSSERYGTYLEWHAMFCGLGEWVETEPLIIPEYDSDSLEYWTLRWKPTEYPIWLSDRRGYRPLDKEFIIDENGDDKHWLRRIPKECFKAAICGETPSSSDVLAIHGDWVVSGKTREVIVGIDTALVEPEPAGALLRLLSVQKERKFWLPCDQDDLDEETTSSPIPFRLWGWLRNISNDIEYDNDDPLRAEVSGLRVVPAESLIVKYKLISKNLPRPIWSQDSEWFSYEAWSDFKYRQDDRRRSPRQVGSNGNRLIIKKEALLSILRNEGLDLIADVKIEHRLENEYGEPSQWNDKKRRHTSHKAFLFRQNGEIQDEKGRVGFWHSNRPTIGRGRRV